MSLKVSFRSVILILSFTLLWTSPGHGQDLTELTAQLEVASAQGDPAATLPWLTKLAAREPSGPWPLRLAETHRDLFHLEEAQAAYRQAMASDVTPRSARSYAEYLLALGLFDRAEDVLSIALAVHSTDGELLELRAELAAARDQSGEALGWLAQAWAQGRNRLAWLTRGRLAERAFDEPYRDLIEPALLLAELEQLPSSEQDPRLELLTRTLTPDLADQLVSFLATIERASTLRLGMSALVTLGEEALPHLGQLLERGSPQARHAVLQAIYRAGDPRYVDLLTPYLADEHDPGNFELAQALLALLQARSVTADEAIPRLEAVPAHNAHLPLVLDALATRLEAVGEMERAAHIRQRLSAERAVSSPVEAVALESYWACQERSDLNEVRSLLDHHRRIARLDARLYGLPENDFDDQKNLTIPERLFLRAWSRQHDKELPTSGPMQYHRESRNLLKRIAERQGSWIDCAGHLQPLAALPPGKTLAEDGSEVKLREDNDADNEVHIVVNPKDPRHVVATSNPTGSGGNETYRSSNWGQTWTAGSATVANNCCDPVSYYNRTNVSGTPTDVLYHSTLVAAGAGVRSRVIYSTNNGASWFDCDTNIGSGDRDRQDHAIDTNPASACYNTLYLGHHDGVQYVAASTGQSFPYCQSWKEVSTGINGTIGSAIVVSTNGRAHNFFTQYGSPGGVYQVTTSNCGSSWGSATKIANIFNAGTFEWGIPSTCQRQVYRYPQADSDRQGQSSFLNNIYIVWNDLSGNCTAPGCNGNTTCNNDVYLSIGTPNNRQNPTSWTFATRNLSNALSDDYTDEFYPSLTVDQADGAVYITYYRTNSGSGGINPRKTQVHYVLLKSIDGGVTFEGPLQITNQPTNESGSGANSSMQWGDYAWNDVIDGVAYGVWVDRREGADEDVWASKICSEPSHWSERAPTYSKPATAASSAGNQHTVTWTAPNLYWGDGGEATAQRKIQLWVDGQLAQDHLSAASTSTVWTAPNANSHQLKIRTINSCGIAKDYAPVTVQGGGGGNQAPQVTISQPGNGSSFNEGVAITFSGSANDPEDGNLTSGLTWTSNRDGALGSGGSFAKVLSVGVHTITAQVSDSQSLAGNAAITVTVNAEVSSCNAFDEKFEQGTTGWTQSGLWHLAQSSSCASPGYASATHAMYYGQDAGCDYATGSRSTGDLISPEIQGLVAGSELSFSYFRGVEQEPDTYDIVEVAIAPRGSASWTALWSKDSSHASENAWTTSGAISLAAYAGQTVRLRFRFDSVDGVANDFVGWLIDDVVVTGACAPPVFSDGFVSGDLSGWSIQVGAGL